MLGSYIKQKMHFFVARVNLQEQSKLGYTSLRPIQVAYESPKFMLPLRLGTLNADGYQELFIYTLTKKGRVEPTNYRTLRLPTGMDLPYMSRIASRISIAAMFDRAVTKGGHARRLSRIRLGYELVRSLRRRSAVISKN